MTTRTIGRRQSFPDGPISRYPPRISAASALPCTVLAGIVLLSCVRKPPVRHFSSLHEAHYEVVASDDGELAITAVFPPLRSDRLQIPDGSDQFVRDLKIETANGTRPLPLDGKGWAIECTAGCRVRYRFDLKHAAATFDSLDAAAVLPGAFESTPSTWLIVPALRPENGQLSLHVLPSGNSDFVTGLNPDPSGHANSYIASYSDLELSPYSLFGRFRKTNVTVADAQIELALIGAFPLEKDGMVAAWVNVSARAIRAYYDQFPVRHLLVIVTPTNGGNIEYGRTMAGDGASILVYVGRDVAPAAFRKDWVLAHEMIHLTFPNLDKTHAWLTEGLATYVEPFVRAQAGLLPPQDAWRGLMDGLPNGLPQSGDRGLDYTPTWGRTYWGGALFCLVADLEIRKRTNNVHCLRDALRAIARRQSSSKQPWTVTQVLSLGDEAVGLHVLEDTYAAWSARPVSVDLATLWRELGITEGRESVVFHERAPLAGIRESMTTLH